MPCDGVARGPVGLGDGVANGPVGLGVGAGHGPLGLGFGPEGLGDAEGDRPPGPGGNEGTGLDVGDALGSAEIGAVEPIGAILAGEGTGVAGPGEQNDTVGKADGEATGAVALGVGVGVAEPEPATLDDPMPARWPAVAACPWWPPPLPELTAATAAPPPPIRASPATAPSIRAPLRCDRF